MRCREVKGGLGMSPLAPINWLALLLDVVLLAALLWVASRGIRKGAILGFVVGDCVIYLLVVVLILFGTLLQQVGGILWFDVFGDHPMYEHTALGFASMVLDCADSIDEALLPSVAFSALSVVAPLVLARIGWKWLQRRWFQALCGAIGFMLVQSCVDWVLATLGWNWFVRPFLWQSYLANVCGAPVLSIIATWSYYRVTPGIVASSTPSQRLLFRRTFSILVGLGIVALLLSFRISEPFTLSLSFPRFVRLRHAIVTPLLSQVLRTKSIYELSGTAFAPLRIGSYFAPVHSAPVSITVSRDRSFGVDPVGPNTADQLFSREQELAPLRVDGRGIMLSFGHNPSAENVSFDTLSVVWTDLVVRRIDEGTDGGPEHPYVYHVHTRFASPGPLVATSATNVPLRCELIPTWWRQYDAHPIVGSVATMLGRPKESDVVFSEDGKDAPLLVSQDATPFRLSLLAKRPLPNSIRFNSVNGLDFDVHGPLAKGAYSGGYAFADEIEVVVNDGVIRKFSADETLREGDRVVIRGESPLLIEVRDSGALRITGSFKTLTIAGEDSRNTLWDRCDGYLRTGIVGILGMVVVSFGKWMWGIPTVKKARK